MINCRVCNNQDFYGVIFCTECGSQLAFLTGKKVDTFIYPSQAQGLDFDISNTIPKKIPGPVRDDIFIIFVVKVYHLCQNKNIP